MAANRSSPRATLNSSATRPTASGTSTDFALRLNRRSSLSKSFRPSSTARSFSSAWMKCLILLRAREVTTKLSQSRLGVWPGAVTTSTMSPLASRVRTGTMRPFTRAPTHWCPTSVWTL